MKTVFIIVAIVLLAIWFVVDFVWFRALNERSGDLKEFHDRLDKLDLELQKKKAKLQTEEDCQRVMTKRQEERQRNLNELHKVLNEKDQKLNEKAELLDQREAELQKMLDGAKKEQVKKAKKK